MRRRELAIRVILVTGVLTAIATSPPPGQTVQAERVTSVDASGVTTLLVRYSAAAVEQANELHLVFELDSGPPVTVIPDDPAQPMIEVVGGASLDATERCAPTGPCELGFSLDTGDGRGAALVRVTAFANRGNDASFCFPDNKPFTAEATVEIAITPPPAAPAEATAPPSAEATAPPPAEGIQ